MDAVELAEVFEREFERAPSSIEARAAVAAMGEEYPAGLHTYGWASRTELARVAAEGEAIGAEHVVDLGCGRGGPGVWVAGRTGARLTGVDLAESALVHGRALAESAGVAAEFRQGTFEETGLADEEADLVMSFDAFLFTPDKQAAFVEVARVVRPGGRLAMTSWDYHAQPRNRPPQVDDHRPLADRAGFDVLEYADTEDWRQRCTTFADFLIEHVDEAAAESGAAVEELLEALGDMRVSIDCMIRRFLLVAERRG